MFISYRIGGEWDVMIHTIKYLMVYINSAVLDFLEIYPNNNLI